MLYAVDNKLTHLPVEFRYLHRLETLFLQQNKIRNLDRTLQKARRLKFLELSYNELQEVYSSPRLRHAKFLLSFNFDRISEHTSRWMRKTFYLFARMKFRLIVKSRNVRILLCRIKRVLSREERERERNFEKSKKERERVHLRNCNSRSIVRRAHSEYTCSRILRFNAHDTAGE